MAEETGIKMAKIGMRMVPRPKPEYRVINPAKNEARPKVTNSKQCPYSNC